MSRALPVYIPDRAFADEAGKIAARLGSEVITGLPEKGTDKKDARGGSGVEPLCLLLDSDGLALAGGGMRMRGDLSRLARRVRPGILSGELLVRAARFKHAEGPLRAFDATAGMGEDSLLLAAAGFDMELYEYDPVIALLLEDAVKRAAAGAGAGGADADRLAAAAGRMHVTCGDSIAAMKEIAAGGAETPDLILLDPMFPEKRKNSLTKKKFQLIHQLERPCSDEEELLGAALSARPQRIVIKRPVKGPYLAGVKPDYSIKGKTVRYDCIAAALR